MLGIELKSQSGQMDSCSKMELVCLFPLFNNIMSFFTQHLKSLQILALISIGTCRHPSVIKATNFLLEQENEIQWTFITILYENTMSAETEFSGYVYLSFNTYLPQLNFQINKNHQRYMNQAVSDFLKMTVIFLYLPQENLHFKYQLWGFVWTNQ